MPAVFATVFFPSNSDDIGRSHAARMSAMKAAILQAYAQMGAYAVNMKATNPLFIFLAPEYYFIKDTAVANRTTKWTLYSEEEKKALIKELVKYSSGYPRLLIVPGSIAWQRQRKTPVQSGRRLVIHDGWNTTPVIYHGKLKLEYDKIYDDAGYAQNTDDVLFQKGTGTQLFTIDSLKFGIEVCGDFAEGNLSKEARAESLDFELLISATIGHRFSEDEIFKVPVRNGGYFVHTDYVHSEYCGAWCLHRGSGTHGAMLPSTAMYYDPWTGQKIVADKLGTGLAVGTLLRIDAGASHKQGKYRQTLPTPGTQPPVPTGRPRTGSAPPPFVLTRSAGSLPMPSLGRQRSDSLPKPMEAVEISFALRMRAAQIAPFMNDAGVFQVQATVTLSEGLGPGAFRRVTFSVEGGTTANPVQQTNAQGEATVVCAGNRNAPMTIRASHAGESVAIKIDFIRLSGGNVTRMARLVPEMVPSMRCYFLPV